MENTFQIEEITEFLYKKAHQLAGENQIYRLGLPKKEGDVPLEDLVDISYEMGKGHGAIEAKLQLLTELLDFFHIEKD